MSSIEAFISPRDAAIVTGGTALFGGAAGAFSSIMIEMLGGEDSLAESTLLGAISVPILLFVALGALAGTRALFRSVNKNTA